MSHTVMNPVNRRGFTLVEAIIVAVVIAALLAFFIPYMREQERQRLQTLANTQPWEVFEFHAAPAKESFSEDEDIVIACEIVNLTDYELTLPKNLETFAITFRDNNSGRDNGSGVVFVNPDPVAGFEKGNFLLDPETAIAAVESLSIELQFKPLRVGTAEARVVYYSNGVEVTNFLMLPSESGDRLVAVDVLERPADNEKRFQSNTFQLVVEAGDDSELPPFDLREILAPF